MWRKAAARARARAGVTAVLVDATLGSMDATVGRDARVGLGRPVASNSSGSRGWTGGRSDGLC